MTSPVRLPLVGAVRWPSADDADALAAVTGAAQPAGPNAAQGAAHDAGQDAAQDAGQDAAAADSVTDTDSPYDSIWVGTDIPVQESTGVERLLLSQDKLYTVLAVVLIIWLGIVYLLLRTDRKLARLERSVEEGIASQSGARNSDSPSP